MVADDEIVRAESGEEVKGLLLSDTAIDLGIFGRCLESSLAGIDMHTVYSCWTYQNAVDGYRWHH